MERVVTVDGHRVRYLAAGTGPALVVLYGLGQSPADGRRSFPGWQRRGRCTHRQCPASTGTVARLTSPPRATPSSWGGSWTRSGSSARYSSGTRSRGWWDYSSPLASPGRVVALCLVGSGGLGREVSPTLAAMSEPVPGEVVVVLSRTRAGAVQRAWSKALLLFGRPWLAPAGWLAEQYRLARLPGSSTRPWPSSVTRSVR